MDTMQTSYAAGETMPRQEGELAKTIEHETSKLPSDLFLWTAAAAGGVALALQLGHKKGASNFIAQWVPTLLVLGVYNKMVKLLGHDADDTGA